MKSFKNVVRVRVIAGALASKTGSVCCRCIADNSAWIEMDEDLPDGFRSFPPDDQRARHVRLYPEACEPARKGSKA